MFQQNNEYPLYAHVEAELKSKAYIDDSDLDFVIIANEPNGIWQMATLGKGVKLLYSGMAGKKSLTIT